MSSAEGIPSKCTRRMTGHTGAINAIRFNEKGTYCMTAGQDKTIRLWNPHRPSDEKVDEAVLVKTYQGVHGYDVLDVAISNDNSAFASCGSDKNIFIWDVASGKIIRKFDGHEQTVNCIQYGAFSSVIISGSYDKSIRVWDLRARNAYRPIQTLRACRDSVTSLVVREDEIIASSMDDSIVTFDIRRGTMVRDVLHEAISSVGLSRDGKCVLAGCLDSTCRLIDTQTGRLMNQYQGHLNTNIKLECCFSNTDALVMSGCESGSVFFWDLVHAEKPAHVLHQAHEKAISSIAYHPEKLSMLLTASYDGVAKVWQ